jgi:hypothetical protein
LETFWRIELLGRKNFPCRKAAEKMTRTQKYLQILKEFVGDVSLDMSCDMSHNMPQDMSCDMSHNMPRDMSHYMSHDMLPSIW